MSTPTAATDSANDDRSTVIRHIVVFAAMLMAVLLYLDRYCVGMAQPYIQQDLGLSTLQMSFFFSAFFLTYALFQVPSGWLSDRFGARVMLTIYVLTWSFFTAMMGLSYGFAMLLIMRAAYGIGQAGAYPTSASIISKWVPFSNRGMASSIVAFGGRLGGAIAPILTAFLIVLFVPVDRPSTFNDKSLRNAAALCGRLAPLPPSEQSRKSTEKPTTDKSRKASSPTRSPAIQHVWTLLPSQTQLRVTAVADQYRAVEPSIKAHEEKADSLKRNFRIFSAAAEFKQADDLRITLDNQDRELLVDELNKLVQLDDFYREEDFLELPEKNAAKRFLGQLDPDEPRTPAENQRLNRLLLEACFPDELGNVYVAGWRPVMILYGMAGLLVAGVLWWTLRNRPEDHPRCNSAEQKLIAAGRPPGAPSPHGKAGRVPWGPLMKSRSMWLNCFGQVGTNIGWIFLPIWFPLYLIKVHDVPLIQRGLMASIPLFVGWIGMLSGGWLTDRLVRLLGLRWGRRLPWSGSRFIGMGAFLACLWLDSPWAITAALSLVAISTDLGTSAGWAYCQDVGGRYVGSVLGWGNMWGNLGATVSPVLLAWVFGSFGWDWMFRVCAGAFLFAGLCAMGIDATIPIAPPDTEE